MKKSTTVMMVMGLVFVTSFTFAGSGLAQGPGGRGCGGGSHGFMERAPRATPEQAARAQKLRDSYFQSTNTLRGQLHEKKAVLRALMAALTPDKAKIEATSQELGALRGKLNAERAEFMAQLRKEGIAGLNYFAPRQMNRQGGKQGQSRHMGNGPHNESFQRDHSNQHDDHTVSAVTRDDS
ncbi:MAG: periplasmic heavy metal sensor [Desulfovibrio sp.]|nr:periplasmic heavy metal sensor [Desulfovibrio sp.]